MNFVLYSADWQFFYKQQTDSERKALESTIRKYEEDYKQKERNVRNQLQRIVENVKDLKHKCETDIEAAKVSFSFILHT